jgi:hypothetical protein
MPISPVAAVRVGSIKGRWQVKRRRRRRRRRCYSR